MARELKVPRSLIFALAMEELLDRHDSESLKAALDRAYRDYSTAGEKKWLTATRRNHRQLVRGDC